MVPFFYYESKAEIPKNPKQFNFNQAVGLDPNYALAYAYLADACVTLPFYEARLDSVFRRP